MYKLTKGSVSIIRRDKAGVADAIKDGFKLDGEVKEVPGGYEVVNPSPIFDKAPKAAKD